MDRSLSLGERNFTDELHSTDYQDPSTCLEDLGLDEINDNDFSDFSDEDSFEKNMDEFDKLCQEVFATNTLEPLHCSICGIKLKPG